MTSKYAAEAYQIFHQCNFFLHLFMSLPSSGIQLFFFIFSFLSSYKKKAWKTNTTSISQVNPIHLIKSFVTFYHFYSFWINSVKAVSKWLLCVTMRMQLWKWRLNSRLRKTLFSYFYFLCRFVRVWVGKILLYDDYLKILHIFDASFFIVRQVVNAWHVWLCVTWEVNVDAFVCIYLRIKTKKMLWGSL